MKVLESNCIYDNPLPQLRSRQSCFLFLCQLKDGTLLAVHAISEALESVDAASHISYSKDGGKTWTEPQPMFDKSKYKVPLTDYCKVTCLPDGRLVALGYGFFRENPDLPVGNPENGGILDDFVFYSISEDNGQTWSDLVPIECNWGPHIEASAPITVLKDGTWITPITGFPNWEGKMTGKVCGRALRSEDEGKTWSDDFVCMDMGEELITSYEQRMCQLQSGAILCISWNENMVSGERYENHYSVSYDQGKTWTKPKSTGVLGQSSSVCAIGGERLIALHAVRRDTQRPGIYACKVDFSQGEWNIIEKKLVWEPKTPMFKNEKMAEIFSFLKFGQPGAILLSDGDVMMSHWCVEEGQYKTVATRISLCQNE